MTLLVATTPFRPPFLRPCLSVSPSASTFSFSRIILSFSAASFSLSVALPLFYIRMYIYIYILCTRTECSKRFCENFGYISCWKSREWVYHWSEDLIYVCICIKVSLVSEYNMYVLRTDNFIYFVLVYIFQLCHYNNDLLYQLYHLIIYIYMTDFILKVINTIKICQHSYILVLHLLHIIFTSTIHLN